MTAIKNKDTDTCDVSFEQKLIELRKSMMQYAFTLSRNRAQAEDLTQETILCVLLNKDKFLKDDNFRAWVFTIMYNIFVNEYRKVKRRNNIFDTTPNLYYLNLPQNSGFTSPEGALVLSDIQSVLECFIDKYKVPFQMHLKGYKYEEIAQQMNINLSRVRSRIFFTRKRIQKMLIDYRYEG